MAIVTCGGLCPGLNDVVQGLVRKLEDYGVPEGNILGIRCVACSSPLTERGMHRCAALLASTALASLSACHTPSKEGGGCGKPEPSLRSMKEDDEGEEGMSQVWLQGLLRQAA